MDAGTPRAGDVIAGFAADGRYHFNTADMRSALGRLAKKGLIASPARGFYVILPPPPMRPSNSSSKPAMK